MKHSLIAERDKKVLKELEKYNMDYGNRFAAYIEVGQKFNISGYTVANIVRGARPKKEKKYASIEERNEALLKRLEQLKSEQPNERLGMLYSQLALEFDITFNSITNLLTEIKKNK